MNRSQKGKRPKKKKKNYNPNYSPKFKRFKIKKKKKLLTKMTIKCEFVFWGKKLKYVTLKEKLVPTDIGVSEG